QDDAGNEKTITYGMLLENAKKIAHGLQDWNIEVGETVAIMLPTSEDFFYTFFGILLIGAIPVPIYPPFRPDRIEEYAVRAANILKNAEVRLLITFQKAERLSDLLKVFISSLKAVIT
ncbi:MAG TPA: class I adenylate-forming enzyme family protein, partial [Candidatus Berkiella sp.]|nr:class I adenylate-forming enzyme family protein [Candidatus Berkiella sp.]